MSKNDVGIPFLLVRQSTSATERTSVCNKWSLVTDGLTCTALASQAGITLKQFLAWNPAVSSDCVTNYWLGEAYCVGVSAKYREGGEYMDKNRLKKLAVSSFLLVGSDIVLRILLPLFHKLKRFPLHVLPVSAHNILKRLDDSVLRPPVLTDLPRHFSFPISSNGRRLVSHPPSEHNRLLLIRSWRHVITPFILLRPLLGGPPRKPRKKLGVSNGGHLLPLQRRGKRREQRVDAFRDGAQTEHVGVAEVVYVRCVAPVLFLLVGHQLVRLVVVFLAGRVVLLSRDGEPCRVGIFPSRAGKVPAAVGRARVEFHVEVPHFLQATSQVLQAKRHRVHAFKLVGRGRRRRANKVGHLRRLVHLVPMGAGPPEPETDLGEGGRQQGHGMMHSPRELGAVIAPRTCPDAGNYAQCLGCEGNGKALPQPGAVQLAELREAGGEFEGRGIPVGEDAQLSDAVEEGQAVRVLDGEAASVEGAVQAV
ncbi:hypothetical protein N7522_008142 [Penicillium canescens]|uniref:LysM domain-containing protein n=1 Tax=Penicillium canescens TaxID=5083 RepID=A0AAD6N9V2_PENCN|nr:uncharacterized protein N7446_002892 [Penicillium canescens]KAJ5996482.1 hypothetical protein N7522_008142 [Penicillium canescens]KAJ6044698.1 hypothetical protein N7460_006053 [Penicillium canescens]KAJ6056168.1 hypothetical protein N7444_005266 [Penicillium canescens]KAJ6075115.1 hypothetical protein N7446_002892 [Penicillium canescens]